MRAALLSIGDELTLGQALDTNSAFLAAELVERSITVLEHRTVDDDRTRLAEAIAALAAHHDLLIMTGGLGPTEDDLTRQALGDVLTPGQPLILDEPFLGRLTAWFRSRGLAMPESNQTQAMHPATMRLLPNPNGTAPGLAGRHRGCLVYALPGPPREMGPMFTDYVLPDLPEPGAGPAVLTAAVREFGLGEAEAAERLGELTRRDRMVLVGTTASEAIVSARIRVTDAPAEAEAAIAQTIARIEEAWSPFCFGRDDATLPAVVGDLLRASCKTLATAESCTGGWLGKAIVDQPGSSDYYLGGWVTYANRMKRQCLNVPADALESYGAVSTEVAQAMALGALEASNADYALSTTGVAGPDGGSEDKPVGTVFIALATRDGDGGIAVSVRRFRFTRGRMLVRDRTVKAALQMLRFSLLGVDEHTRLLWEMPLNAAPESEVNRGNG